MQQKSPLTLMAASLLLCAVGGLSACATQDRSASAAAASADVAESSSVRTQHDLRFSAYAPTGNTLPAELKHLVLPNNAPTQYQLIQQGDHTVLHAKADKSASGLRKTVDADPALLPWLVWSWKTNTLLAQADNTRSDKEDAPVRIVLTFAGDTSALPFREQTLGQLVRLVTGEDMPYATLMYIWENRQPVGSVIESAHSGRVKMIVAASGPGEVGQWITLSRNIIEDYRRAFGEAPGKLIGIGVMSDTNRTSGQAEAWYGDIRLSAYGNDRVMAVADH